MKQWHWITLALLVAVSIIAGLLGHHEPGHGHWWDAIPGFYAFYGIAGSCAIIYLSWLLGRKMLHRDEDYYHLDDEDAEKRDDDEEEGD